MVFNVVSFFSLLSVFNYSNKGVKLEALSPKRVFKIEDFTNDAIIIPGVASAGEYMHRLVDLGLDREIIRRSNKGQKIIGICLGFQILTNYSEEDGGVECLGLIKGSTNYLDNNIIHNGWDSFYFDIRELQNNFYRKRKKIVSGRVYFNHELRVDMECDSYSKKLNNNITSFAKR